MKTKLTLRLEVSLIEVAKTISKRTGKSVSEMVADYFSVSLCSNRRNDPTPSLLESAR